MVEEGAKARGRLSVGVRPGAGQGAQEAEPVVQEGTQETNRRVLQPAACRHGHCTEAVRLREAIAWSGPSRRTCIYMTPASTDNHLTPSLKKNGIDFLDPKCLCWWAEPQGDTEFPGRELKPVYFLGFPTATQPLQLTLSPRFPPLPSPPSLFSPPVSPHSSLLPSLGWSMFSQEICLQLDICVPVSEHACPWCTHILVCAVCACTNSCVPVHACRHPRMCRRACTHSVYMLLCEPVSVRPPVPTPQAQISSLYWADLVLTAPPCPHQETRRPRASPPSWRR